MCHAITQWHRQLALNLPPTTTTHTQIHRHINTYDVHNYTRIFNYSIANSSKLWPGHCQCTHIFFLSVFRPWHSRSGQLLDNAITAAHGTALAMNINRRRRRRRRTTTVGIELFLISMAVLSFSFFFSFTFLLLLSSNSVIVLQEGETSENDMRRTRKNKK